MIGRGDRHGFSSLREEAGRGPQEGGEESRNGFHGGLRGENLDGLEYEWRGFMYPIILVDRDPNDAARQQKLFAPILAVRLASSLDEESGL